MDALRWLTNIQQGRIMTTPVQWPFPLQPLPKPPNNKPPRFNPDNYEDAPL